MTKFPHNLPGEFHHFDLFLTRENLEKFTFEMASILQFIFVWCFRQLQSKFFTFSQSFDTDSARTFVPIGNCFL